MNAIYGPSVKSLSTGGTAISIEVIPKRGETILALSDKKNGDMFFPKQYMHFGEDFDSAVRRVLQHFITSTLDSFYVASVRSKVDGNAQWELTLVFVANIESSDPQTGFHITEFTQSTIPAGLTGWSEAQLHTLLGA